MQKKSLVCQEFQKRYYDKNVKPRNYTQMDKVWLNNKYIKIKQNCKLKFQFSKTF